MIKFKCGACLRAILFQGAYMPMIEKIQALARHAGQMMLSYRDAAIHQKEGHYNFVTDADVAVQQFLQKELLSLVPGSRLYAEEQENVLSRRAMAFSFKLILGSPFLRNL